MHHVRRASAPSAHRTRVYGAADPKAGALGSLYEIHRDTRLNHTFAVEAGVLEDECASILKAFFAAKRAQNKQKKKDICS